MIIQNNHTRIYSAVGQSRKTGQWVRLTGLNWPKQSIRQGRQTIDISNLGSRKVKGSESKGPRLGNCVVTSLSQNLWFIRDWTLLPEKAMAPHSSTLAWKIPWTEEPGGLQSMGSLRVGHDWATSLSLFIFLHWRRKWQPTPVFLPGESQGWGSLVGCPIWGRTESDTTEAT